MPIFDYVGTNGNDRYAMADIFPFSHIFYMTGLAGNDHLEGAFLHENFIWGGSGNDTLTGGSKSNTLDGGDGDDVLDTWISSVFNTLTGGQGNDYLRGGSHGNSLDGGAGSDTMIGGDGSDTYNVDNSGDVVIENYLPYWDNDPNPIDTVISQVSWTLGSNLENLTLAGDARNYGSGNALDNVITGNDGANLLKGLGGDDRLFGGKGNDNLQGGDGQDTLSGGAGADKLFGSKGNDYLQGGGGQDTLNGGAGADKLLGNNGDDLLIGGGGADTFIFRLAEGADTIVDFEFGVDRIKILDQAIDFEMLNFEQSGNDVLIYLDTLEILVQNAAIDTLQDTDHFIFL